MFKLLPGLLAVINKNCQVVAANNTCITFFSSRYESILDKKIPELFTADARRLEAAIDITLLNKQSNSVEFIDYGDQILKIELLPLPDEQEEINFILLTINVIQQIKDTEVDYHTIIEQATDGVFIADDKGNYIDVNKGACSMLGYSKQEIITMSTKDIMLPEDLSINPPKFAEMMNGENVLSVRNLKCKDGTIIPVEINGRMLKNGRMLGIVRDITQRKKLEDAIQRNNALLEEKVKERTSELENKIRQLKESEDKFQKAFNASSAGISLTRLADSKYVDVNNAFLELIEYSREEVINNSSTGLGIIVNMKKREEVLQQMLEKGSVKHMEMTIKTKSGRFIEILSSIETIVHDGEKFAINIIYDITPLKRTQQELEEVNKELEAFSYSVSHDLRAPLRAVIGYAQIIADDFKSSINEEIVRNLKIIQKNASMMGRLIDDLLDFSRLGKKELKKLHVDTLLLVQENIKELQTTVPGTPEFTLGDLLPANADYAMLNQVWHNLISNALKYSSKKPNPQIQIGSYKQAKETVFYIKDNGAGFSMKYSSKLFGVFQRLHHTSEFEGTGVGLALVKRIIDKHGGQIWAEGKEGEGASFFFSLPDFDNAHAT